MSDESGQREIYVQSFPESGGKWLISTSGGVYPQWRADGRELFYLGPDGNLMGVDVDIEADGDTPVAGIPQAGRSSQSTVRVPRRFNATTTR